jgi:hypothetical protein
MEAQMLYYFDTKSGQFRGQFISHFYDGDTDDYDRRFDFLSFNYDEMETLPDLPVEYAKFYIDFANVSQPPYPDVKLLGVDDWIAFEEFEKFNWIYPLEGMNEDRLLRLPDDTGPVFGIYDEQHGLMDGRYIVEPTECWAEAARVLNVAIRAQAYLSGRTDKGMLDDAICFILHTGRGKDDFYWECVLPMPYLDSPYLDVVEMPDEDKKLRLLPIKEKSAPGYNFLISWQPHHTNDWRGKHVSVSMIPAAMSEQLTKPVAYASHSYLANNLKTEDFARLLLGHLVRALILIHTHRIYHDLSNGVYGVAYNCLLERLWHSFASDAALGKLGICTHCGEVFEAMGERRDTKQYCSITCQANAKSARQYRRKKLRELIVSLGGKRPTIEQARAATNYTLVTEEMIDQAMEQFAAAMAKAKKGN